MDQSPARILEDKLRHGLYWSDQSASAAVDRIQAWAEVDYHPDAVGPLLRHFTNPPYSWMPDELAKQDVITIAGMLPEVGGNATANEARDKWMYDLKCEGKTYKQIQVALSKEHSEWDQLETEQAVGRAIDRYCDRKKIPRERRKK